MVEVVLLSGSKRISDVELDALRDFCQCYNFRIKRV